MAGIAIAALAGAAGVGIVAGLTGQLGDTATVGAPKVTDPSVGGGQHGPDGQGRGDDGAGGRGGDQGRGDWEPGSDGGRGGGKDGRGHLPGARGEMPGSRDGSGHLGGRGFAGSDGQGTMPGQDGQGTVPGQDGQGSGGVTDPGATDQGS